jgi:hypothetical protein
MYNELKSTIKEIKRAKSGNQYIQYSQYIAEQIDNAPIHIWICAIDKTIKYTDYLAEQCYISTSYHEYK